jgi:hypothetical protein
MTIRKQYNMLLKSGILLEMYEGYGFTGIWLEDKHQFEKIYEMEQSFTNNLDVIDEEYGEF